MKVLLAFAALPLTACAIVSPPPPPPTPPPTFPAAVAPVASMLGCASATKGTLSSPPKGLAGVWTCHLYDPAQDDLDIYVFATTAARDAYSKATLPNVGVGAIGTYDKAVVVAWTDAGLARLAQRR